MPRRSAGKGVREVGEAAQVHVRIAVKDIDTVAEYRRPSGAGDRQADFKVEVIIQAADAIIVYVAHRTAQRIDRLARRVKSQTSISFATLSWQPGSGSATCSVTVPITIQGFALSRRGQGVDTDRYEGLRRKIGDSAEAAWDAGFSAGRLGGFAGMRRLLFSACPRRADGAAG